LIARPLARLAGLRGAALDARLAALLAAVRLTPGHLAMRPAQLSGGLKQRVAIARAFAGDPRVVICDEPTSALDVSVQAAILNLLVDLQQRAGVSFLFISHDLGVVRYLADRIAVMYRGRIVEIGPAEAVFGGPHHPYTAALLSAVPGAGHARVALPDGPPGPEAGCVFSGRCPRKLGAVCETVAPPFAEQEGHAIRCHIPREGLEVGSTPR
jgi:peptide/nickel transport system ATP-binding protein